MTRGLLIAAPASGSGKTLVTLALLRHFRDAGLTVASVKVGPDYIDPAFHAAAAGRPCINLDTWAMRPETVADLAERAGRDAELILGEGVMGLFDGAPGGGGSTADLARLTGWPLVLVVDARGMGTTAGAVVRGLAGFAPDLAVAGVVFNRVGGEGHRRILRDALAPLGIPLLGCLPRDPALALPERHLGLVQAGEHGDLERFLAAAADLIARHLDTAALAGLAGPARLAPAEAALPLPPPGARVAVAADAAFAFCYPWLLDSWRRAGAEIVLFSPLADEAPCRRADAVYLPGGYPELHAARLSGNGGFLAGLRAAARRGAFVYGECGGYMVLGRGLIDADGGRHAMAGLLPLETSFAQPRLTLGYRRLEAAAPTALGGPGQRLRGHEFHYARTISEQGPGPLFHLRDAAGEPLGPAGLAQNNVAGSFVHLIDRCPSPDAAVAPGRSVEDGAAPRGPIDR